MQATGSRHSPTGSTVSPRPSTPVQRRSQTPHRLHTARDAHTPSHIPLHRRLVLFAQAGRCRLLVCCCLAHHILHHIRSTLLQCHQLHKHTQTTQPRSHGIHPSSQVLPKRAIQATTTANQHIASNGANTHSPPRPTASLMPRSPPQPLPPLPLSPTTASTHAVAPPRSRAIAGTRW